MDLKFPYNIESIVQITKIIVDKIATVLLDLFSFTLRY